MNELRPPPTVLKFGGAALADGDGVRRAAELLLEWGGERPVAVVSALGGVTEKLDRLVREAVGGETDLGSVRVRHRAVLRQLRLDSELCDRHLAELATVLGAVAERGRLDESTRDSALSFGERMSARIVAAHLRDRGVEATPVDAFDLGLETDSNHGRARPLPGVERAIRAALEAMPGIPVVTGFLAVDSSGSLTTLGRNGSDLTAALLAAALAAREVQFWKAVGGVMTADPALVPGARPVVRLSYADAAEFARAGAGVLHPDALEPLEAAGIPARVLDVEHPGRPGTLIAAGPRAPGPIGVAARSDPAGITVVGRVEADLVRERLDSAGVRVLRVEQRGPGRCPFFAVPRDELRGAAVAAHAFFPRPLAKETP